VAIYVMLTKLTDHGRKTIECNPERTKQVNKEVEEMGAKILAQYALLGPYDFVNILDAPDKQTITKVSMNLGARGTMQCTTMAAMTLEEFIGAMTR